MEKSNKLKVTILGSGTSTGVPTIACACSVCTSGEPKNIRSRASIMVTNLESSERLVIDTSPDFRLQMLRAGVANLSQVLYTHTHADHCHGFDDLRAFYFVTRKPVVCYLSSQFHGEFKTRFSYAFTSSDSKGATPQVDLREIPQNPFTVNDLTIEPISLPHGTMTTTGFRFGNFAYITDFKSFPEHMIPKWRGQLHTMVASGVRFRPHPTHSSVQETIHLFEKLHVERGILTHLSHDVDYVRDSPKLPDHVSFAYDGLEFEV